MIINRSTRISISGLRIKEQVSNDFKVIILYHRDLSLFPLALSAVKRKWGWFVSHKAAHTSCVLWLPSSHYPCKTHIPPSGCNTQLNYLDYLYVDRSPRVRSPTSRPEPQTTASKLPFSEATRTTFTQVAFLPTHHVMEVYGEREWNEPRVSHYGIK